MYISSKVAEKVTGEGSIYLFPERIGKWIPGISIYLFLSIYILEFPRHLRSLQESALSIFGSEMATAPGQIGDLAIHWGSPLVTKEVADSVVLIRLKSKM